LIALQHIHDPPPTDAEISAAIIKATQDFDRQTHLQEKAECLD